jgi:hypothetical protein
LRDRQISGGRFLRLLDEAMERIERPVMKAGENHCPSKKNNNLATE